MNTNDITRPSRRRFLALASAAAASTVAPLDASRLQGSAAGKARRFTWPGFLDLQVNGFAGVDFGDPALSAEALLRAVEAIGKTGVTRFLPTLITSSLEAFSACARVVARASHPAIAGIHMEGPYISPEDGYRGAHARAFVRGADVDDFRRRQEAAEGRIRLVTLEEQGLAGRELGRLRHLLEGEKLLRLERRADADEPHIASGAGFPCTRMWTERSGLHVLALRHRLKFTSGVSAIPPLDLGVRLTQKIKALLQS